MNKFPLNYAVTAELIPLFKQELVECKVQPGETVCLFTDPRTNPHYPAAFFGAAKELGANVFQLVVPFFTRTSKSVGRAYSDDIIPPHGPLEAMKASGLIVDMSTVGWLYTNIHNEVLKSGARTLMVREPEECLRRMLPCPEVRKRSLAGAAVMDKGKKVRVKSRAGTDLTFDKTGRKGQFQYGAADIPGRWDHWPSGQVATAPIEGSAEGVLVLDVGDIILRIDRYVSEPIICHLEGGRIARIEGGLDAYILREYMNAWNDEKAFIPAHIGWGTEHRAIWYTLGLRHVGGGVEDAASYYGAILLGVGANHFIGLGGKNVSAAHIDFCLRHCDLWIDDVQVFKDGVILPQDLK
jgi:2,5-dihydroxypyridine 5,6-dioxygenase